jgi:hypothetical protein
MTNNKSATGVKDESTDTEGESAADIRLTLPCLLRFYSQ